MLVAVTKPGECFGTVGFFTGFETTSTAVSNKFSTVMKIDRNTMLDILKEDEQDYEKFIELKDKISLDR